MTDAALLLLILLAGFTWALWPLVPWAAEWLRTCGVCRARGHVVRHINAENPEFGWICSRCQRAGTWMRPPKIQAR